MTVSFGISEAEADERRFIMEEKRAIKSDHDEGAAYHAERIVKQGIEYPVRGEYSCRAAARFFVEVIDLDAVIEYATADRGIEGSEEYVKAVESAVMKNGSPKALQALLLKAAEEMMVKAFEVERFHIGV